MPRPTSVPSQALRVREMTTAHDATGTTIRARVVPVAAPGQGPRERAIHAPAAARPATKRRSASTANRSSDCSAVIAQSAATSTASARRSGGEGRGRRPRWNASRAAAITSTAMTRPEAVM